MVVAVICLSALQVCIIPSNRRKKGNTQAWNHACCLFGLYLKIANNLKSLKQEIKFILEHA